MDLDKELKEKGISGELYQAVFNKLANAYGINFDEDKTTKSEKTEELKNDDPNMLEFYLQDLNTDLLRDLFHSVTLDILTEQGSEIFIENN